MKFSSFALLLLVLFLFNCKEKDISYSVKNGSVKTKKTVLKSDEFLLKGTVLAEDLSEVLLYKIKNDSLQLLTNLKVLDRKFLYKGTTAQPEFYAIKKDTSELAFPFLVDNSEITIWLHDNLSQSRTFADSKLQKTYKSYSKSLDSIDYLKLQLLNKYPILSSKNVKKINEEKLALSKLKTTKTLNFIANNSDSKIAALELNKHKETFDIKKIRELYNSLSANVKTTPFAVDLDSAIVKIENKFKNAVVETKVDEYRAPAYAISGKNPDGQTISLNSIPKGKVVLVDFWASWCKPCRATNPNLVRLYNKYKSQGLEILSISEDSSEPQWINAIAQDNLNWRYHLIDKNKAIAFRYGVETIPFKLLIDKKGRIASEKISGIKLENRIKQLLKE